MSREYDALAPEEIEELRANPRMVHLYDAHRIVSLLLDRPTLLPELVALTQRITALKMAAVYPDGRPAPYGYVGGWNDAINEIVGLIAEVEDTLNGR